MNLEILWYIGTYLLIGLSLTTLWRLKQGTQMFLDGLLLGVVGWPIVGLGILMDWLARTRL